jgi:hypothetical protein
MRPTSLVTFSSLCVSVPIRQPCGCYLYTSIRRTARSDVPQVPLAAIPEALAIVRLHSCYPWHTGGAYRALMAPGDEALLEAVRDFNRFDLYSKGEQLPRPAGTLRLPGWLHGASTCTPHGLGAAVLI